MDMDQSPWEKSVRRRPTAARQASGGKPRPLRNRYAFAAPSRPGGIPSRNFFRSAIAAASATAPGEATSRSASSTRSREKRRDASFHAIFAGPYRRSSWYERASRRHPYDGLTGPPFSKSSHVRSEVEETPRTRNEKSSGLLACRSASSRV